MQIIDNEFGQLIWNSGFDWWEGSIRPSSSDPFVLYIFSRDSPDKIITNEARAALAKLRNLESVCRDFAASQLLDIYNQEWSDCGAIESDEFARRLTTDAIEVHESGYAEVHFGDGGMFWGHGVGVRIQEDGNFQEAVVEG